MYLDDKIKLIAAHSGRPCAELLEILVEDLRLCHDAARDREEIEGEEVYRSRCNIMLVSANLLRRKAHGKNREYLDALEGVLLGVMRGA